MEKDGFRRIISNRKGDSSPKAGLRLLPQVIGVMKAPVKNFKH